MQRSNCKAHYLVIEPHDGALPANITITETLKPRLSRFDWRRQNFRGCFALPANDWRGNDPGERGSVRVATHPEEGQDLRADHDGLGAQVFEAHSQVVARHVPFAIIRRPGG